MTVQSQPMTRQPGPGKRLAGFFSRQSTWDGIIILGMIILKLLVTASTARDTLAVDGDWLHVSIIDGLFLVSSLAAAHLGSSKLALTVRPIFAAAAWAVYIAMLYIAVEAGLSTGNVVVSLIARAGGFVLLIIDTGQYLSALLAKRATRRTQPVPFHVRVMRANLSIGYVLMLVLTAPLAWVIGGCVYVARAYMQELRRVRAGSKQTEHAASQSARTQHPPRRASGEAALQAHLIEQADGTWVWLCPTCQTRSDDAIVRGKKTYPTQANASKAFAGHAGRHTDNGHTQERVLDSTAPALAALAKNGHNESAS